jgi:hypothetical protein
MRTLLSFALATAVVGCGAEGPAGPAGPAGAQGVAGIGGIDGSRLKHIVETGSDGSTSIAPDIFYDSARMENCTIKYSDKKGVTRCMPLLDGEALPVSTPLYLDAQCTMALYATDGTPTWKYLYFGAGNGYKIFTFASTPKPPQAYNYDPMAGCTSAPVTPLPYFYKGTEVDPSAFVSFMP